MTVKKPHGSSARGQGEKSLTLGRDAVARGLASGELRDGGGGFPFPGNANGSPVRTLAEIVHLRRVDWTKPLVAREKPDVVTAQHGAEAPRCGRPPDWRWLRAVRLVEDGRRGSRRLDDDRVRKAVRFVRQVRRRLGDAVRARLAARWPGVFKAHALFSTSPCWDRWELEARLLTEEPIDRIAARLCLDAQAVVAYHDLFFDVRHRLRSKDWIANHVLGQSARGGQAQADVGALLKWYAYHGGPLVLDSVLDYLRHPPAVPDRPERLGSEEFRSLCDQFLVKGSILGGTLPAGDPRSLKKLALIAEATDKIRRASQAVAADDELDVSMHAALDIVDRAANCIEGPTLTSGARGSGPWFGPVPGIVHAAAAAA